MNRRFTLFPLITILVFVIILPGLAVDLKAADTTRVKVGPGVTKVRIIDQDLPLHVVALKIDMTRQENRIEMALANNRLDRGFETVDKISRRKKSDCQVVIGAINADYFGINEPMNPYTFMRNSMVMDNQLVFTGFRDSTYFGIQKDGSLFIGRVAFEGWFSTTKGEQFQVHGVNNRRKPDAPVMYNSYFGDRTREFFGGMEWLLTPVSTPALNETATYTIEKISDSGGVEIKPGQLVLSVEGSMADALRESLKLGDNLEVHLALHAIHPGGIGSSSPFAQLSGGGPHLLHNGEHATDNFLGFEGFSERHSGMRHNRSAVGFSKDSTRLYLVAIDGRWPDFSVGSTPAETADIMKNLGAWNAVNLDGGGSTTLIVRDAMANRHDSQEIMRPVANALVVVSRLDVTEVSSGLVITPPGDITIKAGESVDLSARIVDRWGYLLPVVPGQIQWKSDATGGYTLANGSFVFHAESEGLYKVLSSFAEWTDTVRVQVKP